MMTLFHCCSSPSWGDYFVNFPYNLFAPRLCKVEPLLDEIRVRMHIVIIHRRHLKTQDQFINYCKIGGAEFVFGLVNPL